jgi:hypothetical protein
MATTKTGRDLVKDQLWIWGFLVSQGVYFWVQHRWPDSRASTAAPLVMSAVFVSWFGYKASTGYLLRKPHWTRESWKRYLRLAAMPIAVLILFFTEVFLFDTKLYDAKIFRLVFGGPNSLLRSLWIVVDLALMVFGAIGLAAAIDWLNRGEPSEQFTRTRWFRRSRGSAIAD